MWTLDALFVEWRNNGLWPICIWHYLNYNRFLFWRVNFGHIGRHLSSTLIISIFVSSGDLMCSFTLELDATVDFKRTGYDLFLTRQSTRTRDWRRLDFTRAINHPFCGTVILLDSTVAVVRYIFSGWSRSQFKRDNDQSRTYKRRRKRREKRRRITQSRWLPRRKSVQYQVMCSIAVSHFPRVATYAMVWTREKDFTSSMR